MISATRIEVSPGRMRIILSLDEDAPEIAEPGIVQRALAEHPTLPLHSCINSCGPTFGDVMESTSVPHLLEHLVIAGQARLAEEAGMDDATFVGTTEWASADHRTAVTEVSFVDDIHAVTALNAALALLNG